jgi:hypothetical protein
MLSSSEKTFATRKPSLPLKLKKFVREELEKLGKIEIKQFPPKPEKPLFNSIFPNPFPKTSEEKIKKKMSRILTFFFI